MMLKNKRRVLAALALVAFGLAIQKPLVRSVWADHDEDEEHEGHEGHSGGYSFDRRLPSPINATWKAECSSCHMLYPPGLLPARSWTSMMNGLDKHFGENASLDPKPKEEITRFLVANAADVSGNRRSGKISSSISSDKAPLRITETPYFIRKHDEIRPSVFKRPKIKSAANCIACHKGAEQGNFEEDQVRIPR